MTISCPRCGLAFETQAVTNTRCRRCKTVVRIGSGQAGQSRRAAEPAPEEPSAELAGGGSIIVIAAGVVILAFYIVPAIVRAVRRRRADTAPTLAPDNPVSGSAPPAATAADDATRAHTGPTTAGVDPAA